MVKWVTRTFSYIDRYYVVRHEEPTLENAGYMCFKKEVFDSIAPDVRRAALRIVRRERDGETVDRALLKAVLGIFVEMGMGKLDVYTQEWETPFLEATAEFYRRTSAKWAEEDSFPEFMVKADAGFAEEQERAAQYLNAQTQDRLLRVYEKEVLVLHQANMLAKENSGLVALLENSKYDDLQRLFRLYNRVTQGLLPIGQILKTHIQREGMELVREQRSRLENLKQADQSKSMPDGGKPSAASTSAAASSGSHSGKPDFIQSLLALHDRYMHLVSDCFGSHAVFIKAMKEAFERFVNERVGDSSTAQLFANYCDSLLNTGGSGAKMSESDVETQLEKLVKLFTYLSEKDIFQEFCRKQLAKRLLLDRSHSDDAERFLITKLKQSCGAHFTSKLEGMIVDINMSKETHQLQFTQWNLQRTGASAEDASVQSMSGAAVVDGVDFNVRVLTTGHWPTYSEEVIILPPQLAACEARFKEYYDIKTAQRVLRWYHSLGKGSLETSLFVGKKPYKKIELHVSTHHLCILILFNTTDQLSYGQILEAVQSKTTDREGNAVESGEDLIKASLVSLMSKKYPLLTKEPKGREFNLSDVFRLNLKFVSPKRRLNIPMPTAKISEQEREAAHETVVEDRRHAIEAAIVRVMKQNKTLEHQRLIMEVSKLCNPVFKPEPRAIKNRVEELINRDYLARQEGSNAAYEYLA
ncbi:unnamed protein product [Chondrus crispus]|uniref:Cullin family profile domain-containing protein n=1 Tax=Chondrus crispus TaxID=2769 RepID=R7QFX1_CHOCR|nr:unnamed protein product [Chondrus crispus]CDF36964.1 unnamed protein product [Chondrus crispus]|eukprot:XP_005716783.1 unnamed protein product [Chondrus crispus]